MKKVLLLFISVVIAGVLISGCTSPPSGNVTPTVTPTSTTPAAQYTVMTSSTSQLGTFLVDGNGKTLYNFTTDSKDMSTCTGGCLGVWPVFYTQTIVVPSDLSATDFTSFTRGDGSMQTAYRGEPLYYYVGDTSPGDTTGQGLNQFGGLWYVVPPDAAGYT
jgi:predicted lipoprotein with Yx(FWY)xxD motif